MKRPLNISNSETLTHIYYCASLISDFFTRLELNSSSFHRLFAPVQSVHCSLSYPAKIRWLFHNVSLVFIVQTPCNVKLSSSRLCSLPLFAPQLLTEVKLTDVKEIKAVIRHYLDNHTVLNVARAVLVSASCHPDVLRNIFHLSSLTTHTHQNCSICIYEGEIQRKKLSSRMSTGLQTFPVCDGLPAVAGWEGSAVALRDK